MLQLLITLITVAIRLAIPVLTIIFLIKGIKYLNKKNKEQ